MQYDEYNPGLNRYFREAEAYKREILPEEETLLFARIHGSDENDAVSARNSLIEANLDLGIALAHMMSERGTALDELASEANIAMLEAVDKYDPARKPGNFRGYAAGVIANALRMRCWEGDRLIMVPARAIRSMFRIYMATEKLEKQLNRAPTGQELSAETKLSLRIIRNRRQIPFGTNSLGEVIPGTGASGKSLADDEDMPRTLGDMIPAPQNEENRPVRRPGSQITSHDERVVLRWALRRLKKYQSLVIKYKFNLDRRNRSTGLSLRELTTAEICRLLKITRSLLRKTYYASIRDLRRMMVEKFLLEFGVQPVSGKVLEKVIQRERLAEMAGRI